MADEGWSYARAGGASYNAPVTDYTDAAESATSTDFQPSLHDGAALSSPSFLADPQMDWTLPYMGGRAAAVDTATRFNGDADSGGRILIDQTAPHVQAAPYHYNDVDSTAPVAAAPQTQSASSSGSCSGMRLAAMMKPFPRQQFPGSSGIVELSQVVESKHYLQPKTEGIQRACSTSKRSSSVPDSPAAAKKPRIETPPPLPTFKVRKEKLGDRITALQQLVSPFGKTDTASVLHDTIEYIKFLHDQVASLSSPYLRCGRPVHQPQQQVSSKGKMDEAKEDLRSRGLCLVPVASTYTVAKETTLEFWHAGTFR